MHQVKWWVRKAADVKVETPKPEPKPSPLPTTTSKSPEKNSGDVKVKSSRVNDD